MATDLLYFRDAYLRNFTGTVVARLDPDVDDGDRRAVALDRTAFYPTGGGQPHDTGTLGGADRDGRAQGRRSRVAHAWKAARCPRWA